MKETKRSLTLFTIVLLLTIVLIGCKANSSDNGNADTTSDPNQNATQDEAVSSSESLSETTEEIYVVKHKL